MKRNVVKSLVISLLIASMVMVFFAGCGSQNQESTEKATDGIVADTTKASSEPAAEEALKGKIVFNIWNQLNNEHVVKAIESVKSMDKYSKVEFVVAEKDEEYLTTVPIKVAAGEQIDIVYNFSPIQQAQWYDAGVIVPLDELVAKKGIDMKSRYGSYSSFAYNGGKVYGMPSGVTVWGLFYNKKIFDDAGVAYPDSKVPMTWNEYRALAAKLTSGSGGSKVYGALHLTWPMYWYGEAIMKLGGGENFYTKDGLSNIEDPAFSSALEATYKMMHTDKSIPTHADVKTSKIAPQAFFNGKYAMFLQGPWMLNWVADKEQYPRDWEIGFAPMPVDEGTQCKSWGISGTYAIAHSSANPDLAFEVILDMEEFAAKETSSEIIALQTPQPKLFVDICDKIKPFDKQFTTENIQGLFLNPDQILYTEKVTGPNNAKYETVINEEVEKYFCQAQDLKTTIANIKSRGNEIIQEAK